MSDFFENISPDNLVNVVRELARRLKSLELREINEVGALDEISDNLGEIRAGRFIAGDGDPEDTNFSGVVMAHPAIELPAGSGKFWNILGAEAGALQFGLDASTGKATFLSGNATIGDSGINVNGLQYGYIVNATNTGIMRYLKLGMTLPSNSNTPAGSILLTQPLGSELIVNGTFDADISGWTTSGIVSWDSATQSMKMASVNALAQSTAFSITAGQFYELKLSVSFVNTSTDLLISVGGKSFAATSLTPTVNIIFSSLRTSASEKLNISVFAYSGSGYVLIDNVSLKPVTSSEILLGDEFIMHRSPMQGEAYLRTSHARTSAPNELVSTATSGGTLAVGYYDTAITFFGDFGETTGIYGSATTTSTNKSITHTWSMAAGVLWAMQYSLKPCFIKGVRIYRSNVGGGTQYLWKEITSPASSPCIDDGSTPIDTSRPVPTRNTLNWAAPKPWCEVYNIPSFTVPNAAWANWNFAKTSAMYADPFGMWTGGYADGGNAYTLWIPVSGVYTFTISGGFVSNATGFRGIRVGSTRAGDYMGIFVPANGGGFTTTLAWSMQKYFAAGDMAFIQLYQNSGSNLAFGDVTSSQAKIVMACVEMD